MVRAGESYKAFRAVAQGSAGDETKDFAILIVYNNSKNVRRDNSVFQIDSEEAMTPNSIEN